MLTLSSAHLKKYRDIAWLLIKYGRSDIVHSVGIEEVLDSDECPYDESHPAGPEELAKDLESLGPTFVKLGQALSTRSDILPQPYLDALARLQDDVAPVPFEDIERVLLEELGVRIEEAFPYFESEPLASASLGQVHRAKLPDGTDVAVKIQRPGIRSEVASDVDALRELAGMLDSHTDFGKKYGFLQIAESLRRRILQELDYRLEAQNCEVLGRNLADRDLLVVPKIYHELSTSRVITMQFLSGTKITELDADRIAAIDGPRLAQELFSVCLQQVLVDGVFHADPHPGNLLLMPDGRIAVMDFGMVAHVPSEMQRNLAKILLSIGESRGEETARETLRISRTPDSADTHAFTRRIARLVSEHHNRSVQDLDAGSIVMGIQAIAGECGIELPDELRMIGKALMNLDRIVAVLAPDFDPNEAIKSHASNIIRKRLTDHLSLSQLYKTMLESAELVQAAPERLNNFTRLLANNELKINVDAIDQNRLMRSIQKIANQITTGLILAALIIGASMMMHLESSFVIFGYPTVAMFFFMTAAVTGLILVYRMTFGNHADE